jgi:23S rRNA (cytosine1962-C5)-methyltransferase
VARRQPTLPELTADPALKGRLSQGHPWIYADQLRGDTRLASGTWVAVHSGSWSGIGLWDARSAIGVRLFSEHAVPDASWVRARVQEAWSLRQPLREAGHTAFRWLYGEGDGLPGITVDLYGDYAVLQTYADSVDVLVPWVVSALHTTTRLRGVLQRTDAEGQDRSDRLNALWGELPPETLTIREHGLSFLANLYAGQKTGLFLDQRDNRQTMRNWARDKSVLNCFAYTGAFSVYAAAGGASHVVTNDIAAAALEDARRNVALNHLDLSAHEFATEDTFALLNRYAEQGRTFDLVILDPPSFARSKQNQYAAIRAYTRLNALALRCVRADGLLASSSCTSQVSPEQFRTMLAAAADTADRRLVTLHDAGHAIDHPVPAHFPEGRYLKFVLSAVREIH